MWRFELIMLVSSRAQLVWILAALVLVLAPVRGAEAAWITIKNDTTVTVIVQEKVLMNGEMKRGKPTTLMPGEALREFLTTPGVKQFDIYDTNNVNKPIWSGSLTCKAEVQSFTMTTEGGKVTMTPLQPVAKK